MQKKRDSVNFIEGKLIYYKYIHCKCIVKTFDKYIQLCNYLRNRIFISINPKMFPALTQIPLSIFTSITRQLLFSCNVSIDYIYPFHCFVWMEPYNMYSIMSGLFHSACFWDSSMFLCVAVNFLIVAINFPIDLWAKFLSRILSQFV